MNLDDDAFDLETEDITMDFIRDGYGRPKVIMPDGSIKIHARVSTIAKLATNQQGLQEWNSCQVALAVAKSPDISAILGCYEYENNHTAIMRYVKEATCRHGGTYAANAGTALHLLTEHGPTRAFIPGWLEDDVDGYRRELERTGLEPIESEVRVVNSDPTLVVAGTLDTLYRCPPGSVFTSPFDGTVWDLSGRVVVGDSKSSRKQLRNVNTAAQEAGYSFGERYDPATGDRAPIHPDLVPEVGIGVHIPLGRGETGCSFLDLRLGRELLRAARTMHRLSNGRLMTSVVPDRP